MQANLFSRVSRIFKSYANTIGTYHIIMVDADRWCLFPREAMPWRPVHIFSVTLQWKALKTLSAFLNKLLRI